MAAMKLTIQVPTVTPSVRIAAVDGCSVERRRGRGECDGQPGIQQVAEQHSHELRQIDASAVASPQHDRQQAARTERDEPSRQQHQRLCGDAREGGMRC